MNDSEPVGFSSPRESIPNLTVTEIKFDDSILSPLSSVSTPHKSNQNWPYYNQNSSPPPKCEVKSPRKGLNGALPNDEDDRSCASDASTTITHSRCRSVSMTDILKKKPVHKALKRRNRSMSIQSKVILAYYIGWTHCQYFIQIFLVNLTLPLLLESHYDLGGLY
jgi:hypothetical protein